MGAGGAVRHLRGGPGLSAGRRCFAPEGKEVREMMTLSEEEKKFTAKLHGSSISAPAFSV
jgi:hypothetical protein